MSVDNSNLIFIPEMKHRSNRQTPVSSIIILYRKIINKFCSY